VNTFLQKFAPHVMGVLSGFDRLVLRGYIRQLGYVDGMSCYMAVNRVRTTDFKDHVLEVTGRLRQAVEEPVHQQGRPVVYLNSTKIDKEKTVQRIAAQDRVRTGTICLVSCVEPCRTFEIHRSREQKKLELKSCLSRCLFFYKYGIHPELGYYHARIQSWFPFSVQIYLNGREWLARQMDAARLRYRRSDNTFVWLEDVDQAQTLMNEQLRTRWPQLLEQILRDLNPLHPAMLGKFRAPYYWSVYQAEWASDIMFKSSSDLVSIYEPLALHAIRSLHGVDVLRFLGSQRPTCFRGDVRSNLTERAEGIRIKHTANGNSIKVYDKAYATSPRDWSVLRLETTTANPHGFKVYRTAEGKNRRAKQWLPLRKGVADLHRLAEVSQAANDRYAEALSASDCSEPLAQLLRKLVAPTSLGKRRVRGLRPWAPGDLVLLRAANRGEFAINGLRNRDLQALLYDKPTSDPRERRRRSARVGRLLRLLRAHGILKKVPRTHRYQVTTTGRQALAVTLAAADATTAQLTRLAA
jgi:hypothetical protein